MRGDQGAPGIPLGAKLGGYAVLAIAVLVVASFAVVIAGPYLVVGGLIAAAVFVALKLTKTLRNRGVDAETPSSAVAMQEQRPKPDIARRRIDPGR